MKYIDEKFSCSLLKKDIDKKKPVVTGRKTLCWAL